MKAIKTDIPDVLIFEPRVFGDERGFFFESFSQVTFNEIVGYDVNFVQDNHSRSAKGVLRGLHYQLEPFAQGKLVRCVSGSVLDVAVDIRKSSPHYGQWVAIKLSAENKRQLWIPEGFAHGFLALEDNTEFLYKTTNYYNPASERSIRWDDAVLNINWGVTSPVVSAKDEIAAAFSEL